jgi:predicted Zn-dependent protease
MKDKRTARASTNRIDEESIRQAVRDAIALMHSQAPDERLLELTQPAPYAPSMRWDEPTALCRPAQRAEAVREAISFAQSAGLTAAGILSTGESAEAIVNSNGLLCRHRESDARFSITVMGGDSSGWAKASSTNLSDLDVRALAATAVRKTLLSRQPVEIPPGRYTVILEPAAVLDLVGQIFADFSGTALQDKRSFLTDRLGMPLFGPNISITDDVFHPLQDGAPFDGEGVPRRRLTLVHKGSPVEVAWCRAAAERNGKTPTGHGYPIPNEIGDGPANIVIAGGEFSLEQMIRSTGRGVLVTRLWYIREVDPYSKRMTGMTRDGTFLVEGGEPVRGLLNFRFNQSVVEMLNQVELLGPAQRASGEEVMDMVVPAMKVAGFQFSEVTKF